MKFFKCKKCGKIVALIKASACGTFCCDEEMSELVAGTTDAAVEKHVPVVAVNGASIDVTVGSMAHPMEEKHFIEWIAVESEQGVQIKCLKPGQEPKASFALTASDKFVQAYAYCNLHGLWSSK